MRPRVKPPSRREGGLRAWRLRLPARVALGADDGFTLIEVLATALIVVLISVGVAQALIAGAHLSGYQQHRSVGDEIAQQDQERLRGLSVKQLSGLATAQSYAVTLSGTVYTVSSQATLESPSGQANCTATGTNAAAYYHTVSTVTWTDVNGSHSVSEDSLITPPASGTLLTQVVDQTGTGVLGATVTATGQSTGGDVATGTTDSTGCLIFTGLNPDDYSISVTDPGYVDINGNSTVSDSATVTTSGTAKPVNNPEVIGSAGTVTGSFSTVAYTSGSTVGTITGQYATDMSWYGTGGTQSMSATKSVTSTQTQGSASLTASNLFPFGFSGSPWTYTNNYHIWAGSCVQEEPPTGYDSATVTPGSTQAITLQEPALDVTVTYNGSRIAPGHAKLSFTSTLGTSCTDTWNEAISASAATSTNGVFAYPGVPFASTATTGSNASASGLTGTLAVCADYTTGGTTRKVTVPGLTATNFTAPTAVSVPITSTSPTGTC